MTRYEEIEKALRLILTYPKVSEHIGTLLYDDAVMALALPEDSKVVNAELYGLAIAMADPVARVAALWPNDNKGRRRGRRYIELREASGEPMPYKVIRDGDKVRFK